MKKMRLLPLIIAAMLSACGTVQPAGPQLSGRWTVVHSNADPSGVADALVLITFWTYEAVPGHGRTFCDRIEAAKTAKDGSFEVTAHGTRHTLMISAHKPGYAAPLKSVGSDAARRLVFLAPNASHAELVRHFETLLGISGCSSGRNGPQVAKVLESVAQELRVIAKNAKEKELLFHIEAAAKSHREGR
jgi:hypothetical protein